MNTETRDTTNDVQDPIVTSGDILAAVDACTDEHELLHGVVHYSGLRCFAKSPAHYREYVLNGRKATRPMNVGTIAHAIVLGPHTRRPLLTYPGAPPNPKTGERNMKRQGDAWKEWEAEQHAKYGERGCTLVTKPEYDEAARVADAILADREARTLLDGTRREVALKWTDTGLAFETDGIDLVGDGYIGELKLTACTEPEKFATQAWRMLYHAQLACLERAANLNSISTANGLFIIAAETTAPYPVVCMQLSPRMIEEGQKSLALWTERLLACRAENHWPGYVQRVIDLDPPTWLDEEEA